MPVSGWTSQLHIESELTEDQCLKLGWTFECPENLEILVIFGYAASFFGWFFASFGQSEVDVDQPVWNRCGWAAVGIVASGVPTGCHCTSHF